MCVWVSVSVFVCVFVSECKCVFVYICMCVCVYMSVWVCVWMWEGISFYFTKLLDIFLLVCIVFSTLESFFSVWVWALVSVCVCSCMYVRVCVYVFVYYFTINDHMEYCVILTILKISLMSRSVHGLFVLLKFVNVFVFKYRILE